MKGNSIAMMISNRYTSNSCSRYYLKGCSLKQGDKTCGKESRSASLTIESTRQRKCVKSVRRTSKRYAFSSCLRYISLGYRLKTQVKSEVATMTRGGPL
jgi:hypothetical protein